MFKNPPNLSIFAQGVIGSFIGLGVVHIKHSIFPTLTYGDGIKEGYAQAKRELQNEAKQAGMKKSMVDDR
jgi:hypothetical protein